MAETAAEIARRYPKIVVWSDEDGCFLGRRPDLFLGGCHGGDPRNVLSEITQIAEDVVGDHLAEGRPLPPITRADQAA